MCGAWDKASECLCALYMPAWQQCVDNSACVSGGACVHTSVTHQALSLKASGMSGLTMTVELNKAERDLPPKSDRRAPLTATTGCPEASNFSAWREKNCVNDSNEERKMENIQDDKSSCVIVLLYVQSAACWRDQKVICGVVCFYNWTTYKLIWKSFWDFGKEEGLALADWMSLEKNSAISCTFESYLALRLKSGTLVQNTPEGHWDDLTDPNFTAQKTQSNGFVRKSTHSDVLLTRTHRHTHAWAPS